MLTACSNVSTTDSGGAESCAKAETLLPTRRQNRSGRIIETVLSQIQSGGASQTEWTAVHSGLGRDYTFSSVIESTKLKIPKNLTSCYGLRPKGGGAVTGRIARELPSSSSMIAEKALERATKSLLISSETKSCLERVELCERSLLMQNQQVYLTGELSHHRVSAILTRLRLTVLAGATLRSGQAQIEVLVANEEMSACTPDEAKTIQKIRVRIIPFVFLLYIISFLDRINIGFAALTMNKELAISSKQYGLVAGIFFVGYFLFEIPSNLMLHKIGARIWIARILITWGILAALTGLVHSVQQLYGVRFLLGLAEAGYFPGIALYLTYWFRQRDQAQAIALFLAGIPVTSILGAPVSGFILVHAHWLSVSSWRWLLILEGIPAVVGGVFTYFLLPSRPAEAKFLSQDEKDWITADLAREEQEKLASHKISAVQALLNKRVWHL